MVDPIRRAARNRDARTAGAEHYHWTVTVVGVPEPVAAGRASELGEA
jgi:hypothetical protein